MSRPAQAALADAGFSEVLVTNRIGATTGMAWAADGTSRLFVTSKTGEIRIVEDGKVLPAPFATVAPLFSESECGLLGIAFDPDFLSNGYVYVFATVSPTEQQIIRYTARGNTGEDPTVIVRGLPTRGANHDGGAVAIGPDGKLYWAVGDNGARVGAGLDLKSLASKIGRAELDGSVPLDNPFVDKDGPNNDYVWARGFRNPFTMAFQPGTGQLWVNVVGSYFEQIVTPSAGDDAGWARYEGDQPADLLQPIVSYPTDAPDPFVIPASGVVRQAGQVTVRTTTPHRFRPGAHVIVAGVADASFNDDVVVSDVLAPTQFGFQQAGPDAVSGGGTATAHDLGGCITGGAFWDSTSVPVEYRGNFFFGDYNSGQIGRVLLSKDNHVQEVRDWGTVSNRIVDMEVGPDGDLYFAPTNGLLYRISYAWPSQALIVSRQHLDVMEGGRAAFSVRLAQPPPAPRAVALTKTGDVDVTIVEGESLSFDASNWSVPQRVVVAAARDDDSSADAARIRVSAGGIGSADVNIRTVEKDVSSFRLSSDALDLEEGASSVFTVALTQAPMTPLLVTVARVAGDTDVGVTGGAELTFTPDDWAIPQQVTVGAAVDSDSLADEATLRVEAEDRRSRDVVVSVADRDAVAPVITSQPITEVVVGRGYVYDAAADGNPPPVFTFDARPDGMVVEPVSGVVAWVPSRIGDYGVSLRADNGIEPVALQSFQIRVVDESSSEGLAGAPSSELGGAGGTSLVEGGQSNRGDGGEASELAGGTAGRDDDGGAGAMEPPVPSDSGCGCRTASGEHRGVSGGLLLGAMAWVARRRHARSVAQGPAMKQMRRPCE